MFKIVASFIRPDAEFEFFGDIYMQYELIQELHNNAKKLSGFLGVDENVYRDDYRCDKALCFDNAQTFYQFAMENKDLLDKRMLLINEYCARTKHEYKYYVIETQDIS
jgi:hypothetical protein